MIVLLVVFGVLIPVAGFASAVLVTMIEEDADRAHRAKWLPPRTDPAQAQELRDQ